MSILVTGGAGYIGSHTCLALLRGGYDVIIVDNLSNSNPESVARVEELAGRKAVFYRADIRDAEKLERVFRENSVEAVIHFAGLKAVKESTEKPLEYYENNVGGTLSLCRAMSACGCKKMVFSSSATVYNQSNVSPLTEDMPAGETTNPYGTTKYFIERILADLCKADQGWRASLLRYFNPIGADKSGRIGEAPNGRPNNLVPFVAQVAVGKHPHVEVTGTDYPTPDGTGIRDYLHVSDLADGHIKALERLMKTPGCETFNLGTGKGSSVLEVIAAYERACGKKLPVVKQPRREGDIAVCYSDPSKAQKLLGWKAEKTLDEMCEDSWRWQSLNPEGY